MSIRVTLQIMNNSLSPRVKRQVNITEVMDITMTAEDVADQLRLAWDRVVTLLQQTAVSSPQRPEERECPEEDENSLF